MAWDLLSLSREKLPSVLHSVFFQFMRIITSWSLLLAREDSFVMPTCPLLKLVEIHSNVKAGQKVHIKSFEQKRQRNERWWYDFQVGGNGGLQD